PSFGRKQRSRLARRAATARWARLGRGVLTLAQIRAVVVEALGERKAKAYLFGSYARGDATARSDLDIAVIVEKMSEDLLGEMAELNSAIHKALGDIRKEIDLLLVDEKTFNEHKAKSWDGSVYHDVHREGVRLV
ncbi:MAG: nucleotidyltransferase domain-containing protein, partial [Dehalococcoidales bacterium]